MYVYLGYVCTISRKDKLRWGGHAHKVTLSSVYLKLHLSARNNVVLDSIFSPSRSTRSAYLSNSSELTTNTTVTFELYEFLIVQLWRVYE